MSNPFFKNHGPFTVIEILKLLDVNEIESREIRNNKFIQEKPVMDIKDLYYSQVNDITFFHSKKYKDAAKKTKAAFCITNQSLKNELHKNCVPIVVENVLVSVSKVTAKFYPDSIYDKFDHTVTEISKTKFKDIVAYCKNVLV